MFRHGARTTNSPNPVDPDIFSCDTKTMESMMNATNFVASTYDILNPQKGNCSLQELIHAGYIQDQNNAKYVIDKYNNLGFPLLEKTEQAYLRSTIIERTLGSFKGFWDVFNSSNYEVHVAEDGQDPMRINTCPYYNEYVEEVRENSEEMNRFNGDLQVLKNILNYSANDSFDWWMAQDEMLSRDFLLMDPPYGVTPQMKNLTNYMQEVHWGLEYCNQNLTQLNTFLKMSSGLLISELITHLNSTQPFIVYAAHAETIAPLLAIATSTYDCTQPEYGAIMEIVTYDDDSMQLYYNGELMTLLACGTTNCAMSDFIAQISEYIVTADQRNTICNGSV